MTEVVTKKYGTLDPSDALAGIALSAVVAGWLGATRHNMLQENKAKRTADISGDPGITRGGTPSASDITPPLDSVALQSLLWVGCQHLEQQNRQKPPGS